jgi:predicted HD phosphohydrolase
MTQALHPRAQFLRMQDSTQADWQLIGGEFMQFASQLPARVIQHLQILQGDYGGFPVDRYTHSLQTATRALRDGRDEEYVVCALLHDIGDTLGSFNHPDIAAAILKPFVSDENHWMVQHHGIFQGHYFFHHIGLDRNLRDNFRAHPCYERTAEFCELYDNPAFDPKAETLPIETFEPLLRRLMAQPRNSVYKAALKTPQAT